MSHTSPSSMTSPPCRIRRRNALVSSVYHNSSLFSGLVAALDDGLNRHNPCPCHSCQATRLNKRTSSQHQDAPPSKRARTSSPPLSSFTSSQLPVIHYCKWCAFPDHPSRQTCRECGRRRAPPAMVQRFEVESTKPSKPLVHSPAIDADTDTSLFTDADTLSFVPEQLMPQSYTALAEHQTYLPIHCGLNYSPQYQSNPLPELPASIPVPVSVPVQQVTPHIQSAGVQHASPQSTIPDPGHFTDFESVCSPESRSMASKSICHLGKHSFPQNHQTYPNEAILDVDKLIEEVSNEISEQSNALEAMGSARMSLISSTLSDVTSESVVALGGSGDAYEHTKTVDHQKAVPDESAADMFLNEMIMSDVENNAEACNDIADLSLTFFDGMFSTLHEQEVC